MLEDPPAPPVCHGGSPLPWGFRIIATGAAVRWRPLAWLTRHVRPVRGVLGHPVGSSASVFFWTSPDILDTPGPFMGVTVVRGAARAGRLPCTPRTGLHVASDIHLLIRDVDLKRRPH